MNTIDRILQFVDYKGFNEAKKGKSLRRFYEFLGIPNGSFKQGRSVGSDNLTKLFDKFPELNMDWVITGRGEMLYEQAKEHAKNEGLTKVAEEQEKYIRSIVQDELNKKNKCRENDVATTGN